VTGAALHDAPPVDRRARLSLARRWLDLDLGSLGPTPRSATGDRNVFAWSAAAAVRGDLEGQILLGRCFAAGRGIAKNLEQARKWFRRAAEAGSSEARYRLRALRLEENRWLRHRHALIGWGGLALLVAYALVEGVRVHPKGVLLYLGLSLAALPIHFGLHAIDRARRRRAPGDAASDGRRDYVYERHIASWIRRPWRLAWVATEDAAFLAPLLWLGVTPWTAAVAGALFGLAHYPSFTARSCALKAIEYGLIAWLVLPWAGLWSIVIGHILWDAGLLTLGAWSRKRDHGYALAHS
jgi:hypothetical protein